MTEVKTEKSGDVVDYIAKAVERGELAHGSGISLRSTWKRAMGLVYGENWREVEFATIEPEEFTAKFEERVAGRCNKETIRIDKSRINRIFRMIRGEGNEKVGPGAEIKMKSLEKYFQILQAAFLEELETKVFRREGEKEYNYYSVPVGKDKVVGLAVPKKLEAKDLKKAYEMLEGALMYEGLKKEGGG